MSSSMNAANGGSLNFDSQKGERLMRASDQECNSKPECLKGAIACGLIEDIPANQKANNGQVNTGKTNQQIIAEAQNLGQKLRNSINQMETLKEGETIGNNERISEDKTTLKGLGGMDDWNPDDNQVKGFVYPADTEGSNKALAQEMRYAVNALFAREHVDDDWEKSIAMLFKKMLSAFSLGFTGIGEGLRSEIPESVHINLTSEEDAFRSFGTLDDEKMESELKNYVENCESIGYKEAFKKFVDKFSKK